MSCSELVQKNSSQVLGIEEFFDGGENGREKECM